MRVTCPVENCQVEIEADHHLCLSHRRIVEDIDPSTWRTLLEIWNNGRGYGTAAYANALRQAAFAALSLISRYR